MIEIVIGLVVVGLFIWMIGGLMWVLTERDFGAGYTWKHLVAVLPILVALGTALMVLCHFIGTSVMEEFR